MSIDMAKETNSSTSKTIQRDILFKKIVRKLTPSIIRKLQRLRRDKIAEQEFSNLSNQDIFEKIYLEQRWGANEQQKRQYSSGDGTRDPEAVTKYANAISNFISEFHSIETAIDVGCGDFTVGSKIFSFFKKFTAIDVARNVIAENKRLYGDIGVDFIECDITSGDLPEADIILARQVLQHLSNKDILNFLKNLGDKFRILILTESLSSSKQFKANIDIFTGPGIRIHKKSGVILHAPPFNIKAIETRELLRYKKGNEIIVTTAYVLRPTLPKN